GEVHAVPLHDEVEDVPSPAAAEALPALPRGRDRERGRLLTVERAQTLPGSTCLLELDRLADDLGDVQLLLDGGCGADRHACVLVLPSRRAARATPRETPSPRLDGRHVWPCQVLTRLRYGSLAS